MSRRPPNKRRITKRKALRKRGAHLLRGLMPLVQDMYRLHARDVEWWSRPARDAAGEIAARYPLCHGIDWPRRVLSDSMNTPYFPFESPRETMRAVCAAVQDNADLAEVVNRIGQLKTQGQGDLALDALEVK